MSWVARPPRDRRWGFMARTILHDVNSGKNYLARLRIIETPWFALFLHRLGEEDPGTDLHDHPWYFKSLILWGGYTEEHAETRDIGNTVRLRQWKRGSVHAMRLDEAHRISRLWRVPTWTLLFVGKRVREWGFYVPREDNHPFASDVYDFVDHELYDNGLRRLEKES